MADLQGWGVPGWVERSRVVGMGFKVRRLESSKVRGKCAAGYGSRAARLGRKRQAGESMKWHARLVRSLGVASSEGTERNGCGVLRSGDLGLDRSRLKAALIENAKSKFGIHGEESNGIGLKLQVKS